MFSSLVASFFLTSPVVLAAEMSAGDYVYNGYIEPPANQLLSEQAWAEVQKMSQIEGLHDRELRDKPGGGPGLGEISLPLHFELSNMLALAFSCVAVIALRMHKMKENR